MNTNTVGTEIYLTMLIFVHAVGCLSKKFANLVQERLSVIGRFSEVKIFILPKREIKNLNFENHK